MVFLTNNFSAKTTSKEPLVSSDLVSTIPEAVITIFFNNLNQKNYETAYDLTNNPLWKPFSKFKTDDVWGGYEKISHPAILEKDYASEYGADKVFEVSFYAFDIRKQKNIFLKYDFHLRHDKDQWIIVRMIYPK